ncbi:hypothetical protein GGH16_003462, partial [Coemansia sp. RSA 560]
MSNSGKKERIHFGTLEKEAVAHAKRKREEEEEHDAMSTTVVDNLLDVSEGAVSARPGAHIDLDQIDEVMGDDEELMLTDDALATRRRAMA